MTLSFPGVVFEVHDNNRRTESEKHPIKTNFFNLHLAFYLLAIRNELKKIIFAAFRNKMGYNTIMILLHITYHDYCHPLVEKLSSLTRMTRWSA